MQKHIVVSTPQSAVSVKTLVTPRGLTLWLVESYAVPLVSLEFAFRGGSSQDPADKAGVGMLLASLLDEGAGDLDAQAFQRALDERAIEISFHADRDAMTGRMRTLVKNLDRAAELLRLAVNQPRFDEEPFIRVREHANARLRHDANDPGSVAAKAWKANAFPGHPYGQPSDGSLELLALIERADLVAAAKRLLARDQLVIAIVGAIDERGGRARRQGLRRSAGEGRSQAGRGGLFRGLWARSTRSRLTCRNRPSVSAARASCARIPTISRASSPPMCSAAPAT